MTSNLQNPIFTDETKAREWLEARVWPQGPICPHCGATEGDVTKLEGSKHPFGRLPVQRVPRAIHRRGKDRFRALQNPAHEMAGRAVPAHGLEMQPSGFDRGDAPCHAVAG
jgi:Transposase zinc-ribbon domain